MRKSGTWRTVVAALDPAFDGVMIFDVETWPIKSVRLRLRRLPHRFKHLALLPKNVELAAYVQWINNNQSHNVDFAMLGVGLNWDGAVRVSVSVSRAWIGANPILPVGVVGAAYPTPAVCNVTCVQGRSWGSEAPRMLWKRSR